MPFWAHGWEGAKAFCTAVVQSGDLRGGSVGMEWGAGEDVPATFQKKRPCAAALVLDDRSGYLLGRSGSCSAVVAFPLHRETESY